MWARLAIIQTSSIAAVAFVGGDQLASAFPSRLSPAAWALLALALVTIAALTHLTMTRLLQQMLQALVLAAMVAVIVAGFLHEGAAAADPVSTPAGGGIGVALVFVMLSYGGWNEAAYLSAEARGGGRAVVRALLGGLLLVVILYLGLNAALIHALGIARLSTNPAPAVTVMDAVFGPGWARAVALAAAAAAITTMNTSAITGARAICALGQQVPLVNRIGRWDQGRSVPTTAILLQTAVTLALMLYGANAPDGFAAMVAFGAPVFWFFLLMTALSLFRLRRTHPRARGFSVPLYPLVPLLFVALCLYMLWSSIGYAHFMLETLHGGRLAGVLGVLILLAGLPLALLAKPLRGQAPR